jgi:L-ascorbate metabolism protein UlaG (beta-lactamase superfamily)
MVPVGGVFTIGPEEAAKVASQLEPKYVIPMHYRTEGMSEEFKELKPLADFLKEMGVENPVPRKDFSPNLSALPENTEVVVLERS